MAIKQITGFNVTLYKAGSKQRIYDIQKLNPKDYWLNDWDLVEMCNGIVLYEGYKVEASELGPDYKQVTIDVK